MLSTQSLIRITCYAVLSEVIYQVSKRIYCKFKKKISPDSVTYSLMQIYKDDASSNCFNKVVFFPDPGLVCRRTVSGRICKDKKCCAIHDQTSLNSLINVLKLSKHSLDICVYMITCSVLGDAIIESHENGVIVRIITESRNSGEEGEVLGSQIGKLRAEGVAVRCQSNSFWMHHKFVVADKEILVNGSFNWTNQAVMGNSENLIITNEGSLVKPFIAEFQKIWNNLSPADSTKDETLK
ncbi:UNVERIFIED_CONTAM: Mitochondrial cardiolipin hydrolase [Trichonephila clavipes]